MAAKPTASSKKSRNSVRYLGAAAVLFAKRPRQFEGHARSAQAAEWVRGRTVGSISYPRVNQDIGARQGAAGFVVIRDNKFQAQAARLIGLGR